MRKLTYYEKLTIIIGIAGLIVAAASLAVALLTAKATSDAQQPATNLPALVLVALGAAASSR